MDADKDNEVVHFMPIKLKKDPTITYPKGFLTISSIMNREATAEKAHREKLIKKSF